MLSGEIFKAKLKFSFFVCVWGLGGGDMLINFLLGFIIWCLEGLSNWNF